MVRKEIAKGYTKALRLPASSANARLGLMSTSAGTRREDKDAQDKDGAEERSIIALDSKCSFVLIAFVLRTCKDDTFAIQNANNIAQKNKLQKLFMIKQWLLISQLYILFSSAPSNQNIETIVSALPPTL